jgi:hypothetical protein
MIVLLVQSLRGPTIGVGIIYISSLRHIVRFIGFRFRFGCYHRVRVIILTHVRGFKLLHWCVYSVSYIFVGFPILEFEFSGF